MTIDALAAEVFVGVVTTLFASAQRLCGTVCFNMEEDVNASSSLFCKPKFVHDIYPALQRRISVSHK